MRIDFADLVFDHGEIWTYEGEPFTGIGFDDEERPDTYDEEAFVNGWPHGFSRTVWKDTGITKTEDWHLADFLHGIRRKFRPDGSVEHAEGVEYGWLIWEVSVAPDGTVTEHPVKEMSPWKRSTYYVPRKERWNFPIPPVNAALDLSQHLPDD
ncbi:hypothetical protein O1R50_18750 [Glycomyces luteolus]|uniref:Uncharacterized protein n=1 Tax=Glycomyces luteolus TaxID=2670330 RepID=A0A9X3PBI1_9ACTN|nr:hypothetical protein [Glycomyces luteolus]MDA1361674.1 hypothetical protein [Glycomyces luteolus]